MSLFNPTNLFWLIPLAGTIIALWMLRLRRRDVTVPSLYLWRALLRDNQANTPFQRLRRHLLLLLQLLAAALLIFALAKPFVYGRGLTGRTIVLIIDTSASMNATDVKPSRLAEAKAEADRFIDQEMNGTDVATVIDASGKPMASTSFTSDKERLKAVIGDIPGTDTIADMPAAFTLAQSLIGSGSGAMVRVYTDGGYSPDDSRRLGQIAFGSAAVKILPIGMPEPDNVAITAMDARRDPSDGSYQIFVNVEQCGHAKHDGATLSLSRNGQLIDARPLVLDNGRQSETFSGKLLSQGGTFTATLEGLDDDLAVDNTASLVLPPPRKRKVLLVSPGNLFLESGLNLDPDVSLEEVSPDDFSTLGKGGAGYAMVVFDGSLPDTPLPPGNYLVFDANNNQTPLLTATGDIRSPQVIDQNRTDPVMRFVDLSGLNLAQAQLAALAPWAVSLAESDSGTIIASGEHSGLRIISVGFALSDSDWPLRVSFPIFLTNAVDWLTAGSGIGANSPDTPVGAIASFTVPTGLSSVTVTCPDGHSNLVAVPSEGAGMVVYDDTDRVGLYRVRGPGGYDQSFAVDLLDASESNLTPQLHADLNRAGVYSANSSGPHLHRVRDDLWPIVAAFALLLLTLEWVVFHRRV
jgi:Ca-activated chloride channel homolog